MRPIAHESVAVLIDISRHRFERRASTSPCFFERAAVRARVRFDARARRAAQALARCDRMRALASSTQRPTVVNRFKQRRASFSCPRADGRSRARARTRADRVTRSRAAAAAGQHYCWRWRREFLLCSSAAQPIFLLLTTSKSIARLSLHSFEASSFFFLARRLARALQATALVVKRALASLCTPRCRRLICLTSKR